ncbi:hypothetical protein H0H93_008188 [Arthromyces matolae]|nr:hypothetical protein H0H93_008188 [Arthromyces matolae]
MGTFIPSIPQIAKDLKTTGSVVRSVLLALELCPEQLIRLSSKNVPELMVWRFIQAFGASPGLSLGAGVIGDIFALEERGAAMGIFFSASLLGPAIAPPVGVFLVPLAYTIGTRYEITSAAVLGACFLPSGIGNMNLLA